MNQLVAGDIMMARIKELETELAAMKASTPQIKDDAIMREIQSTDVIQTDVGAVRGELYLWAAYPDNDKRHKQKVPK